MSKCIRVCLRFAFGIFSSLEYIFEKYVRAPLERHTFLTCDTGIGVIRVLSGFLGCGDSMLAPSGRWSYIGRCIFLVKVLI